MSLSQAQKEQKEHVADNLRLWLKHRLLLADTIVQKIEPGLFPIYDAEILLCCALGAFAAGAWPGKGIDKKRFVQFLINYGRATPSSKTISISSLITSSSTETGKQIQEKFWLQNDPFFAGAPFARDVDVDETKIKVAFPKMSLKEIRKASYASLIYTDLRCGLVHEYELKDGLIDQSFSSTKLSYHNRNGVPRLHVPYKYIKNLVQTACLAYIASWLETDNKKLELEKPSIWWTDQVSSLI